MLAAGGEIVISNFDLEEFAQNSAVALTENGSTTLPLVADHATHGDFLDRDLEVSIQEERPLRPGVGVYQVLVPQIEDGLVGLVVRIRRRKGCVGFRARSLI